MANTINGDGQKVNFAVEELIELGQQIIEHLTKDLSIDWFVDANVLQSGWVERKFRTLANVLSTEEIVRELKKRPEEAKSGLRMVSQLADSNQIASAAWFDKSPESFNLLMDVATQLAPSIRVRTMQIMESESVPQMIAEEKAINQLSNEGDFFACKIASFVEELQFADEHVKRLAKNTRRSWFKHPAKRRVKISEDDFLQSDERLAGFATSNLFLCKRRTCILSNDTDFAAILKQFTDNLLWVASIIDCNITYGKATLDNVVQLWEYRSKDLDNHRMICGMQLAIKVEEKEDVHDFDLHGPAKNELLLCSPLSGQMSRFAFSDKIVKFVDDFKLISLRHSLRMNGIWLPRNTI